MDLYAYLIAPIHPALLEHEDIYYIMRYFMLLNVRLSQIEWNNSRRESRILRHQYANFNCKDQTENIFWPKRKKKEVNLKNGLPKFLFFGKNVSIENYLLSMIIEFYL